MDSVDDQGEIITSFRTRYRQLVNPNMLFVGVDLRGNSCDMRSTQNENDVRIAGFSDQILRSVEWFIFMC